MDLVDRVELHVHMSKWFSGLSSAPIFNSHLREISDICADCLTQMIAAGRD